LKIKYCDRPIPAFLYTLPSPAPHLPPSVPTNVAAAYVTVAIASFKLDDIAVALITAAPVADTATPLVKRARREKPPLNQAISIILQVPDDIVV